MTDTSILDTIIYGRVNPHIYAFSTETIPNCLKVGDTYRPIAVRLQEWRVYYPLLRHVYSHSAMLESGNIFRDYSVHTYLETEKGLHRLQQEDIPTSQHYSNEFFRSATPQDIDDAIGDIARSEREKDGKYQIYSPDRLPVKLTYERTQTFSPRQNQQDAIDRFKEAVGRGRTNLLMYAVMRYGKSFTAMCCAAEMPARLVLVVSAKADVRNEWKRTVESHVRFADYIFVEGEDLLRENDIISKSIGNGKSVVVFLTLQDLQGEDIKAKHAEIFGNEADLLVVDETHFGARAAEYGKVLQGSGLSAREQKTELSGTDTSDDFDEETKKIRSKVRLHLSGTPYRILMGDEFSKDDIIAFCQYTDIADAQEEWDRLHREQDGFREWENPYYGFPQMVRFAFNPSAAAVAKLKELRHAGQTYAFSELFRPCSISRTPDGQHKKFKYQDEVLDLFEVIDGSKADENLLSFLDYDKIKEGHMCRHIVCVLPFRASCDALEQLIAANANRFKNLSRYAVLNIAGVDDERAFKDTESVKARIKQYESEDIPTLTLTVNRMLTGSTVPEWDTMLYLKDTSSPQEYDQAIFRIQNQYVKTYTGKDGQDVKLNMKPQTLLVDFDPDRMFRMQELKSQFYNVNVEENGNSKLRDRIERELSISPIITLNKNAIRQVKASDVMAVVQRYSQEKSIIDESTDIPCDMTLLEDATLRAEIEALREIDAKKGIEFKPIEDDDDGDDDDFHVPDPPSDEDMGRTSNSTEGTTDESSDENKVMGKKLAAFYSKILFYSFLTASRVSSLEDVISSLKEDDENIRIAKHLGLRQRTLCIIQSKSNPFVLSKLDYKIQNINSLMNDASLSPLQRAEVAVKKLTRISDSEVVTPKMVSEELTSFLPENGVTGSTVFLDLASTEGEMACAICNRYKDIVSVKNNIYSVVTSPLAYELTRKIYEALEMPTANIFNTFYASDIIGENADKVIGQLAALHPDIIVGGPPFNSNDAGGRGDSASALYHKYFEVAKEKLKPHYIAMYMKAVWYSGGKGKGLAAFRETMLDDHRIELFHDYPDPSLCGISGLNLRGGVCMFLWNKEHKGECEVYNHINNKTYSEKRYLKTGDETILIRFNKGISVLEKVRALKESNLGETVSQRDPFGFGDSFKSYTRQPASNSDLKIYDVRKRYGYIGKSALDTHYLALCGKWKVLAAKASPGGDEFPHSVISSPIVSEPKSVCTNGLLLIRELKSRQEAENFALYMQTRFFRFMMLLAKNGHNMTAATYRYVPVLDFTRKWTDAQLYEHYNISTDEQNFINEVVKPWNKNQ